MCQERRKKEEARRLEEARLFTAARIPRQFCKHAADAGTAKRGGEETRGGGGSLSTLKKHFLLSHTCAARRSLRSTLQVGDVRKLEVPTSHRTSQTQISCVTASRTYLSMVRRSSSLCSGRGHYILPNSHRAQLCALRSIHVFLRDRSPLVARVFCSCCNPHSVGSIVVHFREPRNLAVLINHISACAGKERRREEELRLEEECAREQQC